LRRTNPLRLLSQLPDYPHINTATDLCTLATTPAMYATLNALEELDHPAYDDYLEMVSAAEELKLERALEPVIREEDPVIVALSGPVVAVVTSVIQGRLGEIEAAQRLAKAVGHRIPDDLIEAARESRESLAPSKPRFRLI